MQTGAIASYPEFLLAALAGLILLWSSRKDTVTPHFPAWLAQPAKACLHLMPERYLAWMENSLLHADWRSRESFGDFACFKCCLPILFLFLAAITPLYVVLPLTVAGWFVPDLILLICVKRRRQEISESLPRALDLMVLCVDAGLGLDATLQKLSADNEALTSALNDELRILNREIFLGKDRQSAYMELYNRTGVDELKTLGSALNQASKLGLSIAKILRAQSEFIRKKQSQKAEEKAMRMPIYMAFPLWFCIMPSLLLLVLGPSLINFYHQLHVGFLAR